MILKRAFYTIIPILLSAAASSPAAESAANPAAEYLPEVVEDRFNPDASESDEPRRGGTLKIRNPAGLAHLNVITSTGAPERTVINQMSDSLVDQDLETLEYYPEMAWHWGETDQIRRKGGEAEPGRIIARNDDSVTFVPGAWKRIYNKYDLREINPEGNYVVLKEEWGGDRIEGKLTVLEYTIRVDEGYESPLAEEAQEVALSELDVYTYKLGQMTEERPYAKPHTLFEFHIRPGVTWSDGQPFTGEDVQFSYETIMNPAVDAQHLRPYYQDIVSCEVSEDGMVVKYEYDKTYFAAIDFLGGITGSTFFVPKHVFNPGQYGGDEEAFGQAFNDHQFKDNPIYTGAYRLKEWRRNDTLTIERNPRYWKNKLEDGAIPGWKQGMPYLDEISWTLYKEAAAVVKDLQRGVLDADFDVEPTTWALAETSSEEFTSKMVRAEHILFGYTYIGWNLNRPYFQDKRVRQALAMLIPREEIARNVHQGIAFPANGPIFVNSPGYDKSVEPIAYDPVGAQKLLARAGWLDRDGDGVLEKRIDGEMVPFEFAYSIHSAREYHQKIADIIKENVEQVGIRMTINKSEWANFLKTVRDKNFDACRFAWGSSIDPDLFQMWHSSQIDNKGDNFVSYSNPRVDELCILIRETLDPLKRWEYVREAHRIIYEDQPYCFLFGFKTNYFYNRKLRGVNLYYSQYPLDFTEWYWAE